MRSPNFRYPGGKESVRDEIIKFFPTEGTRYVEPFAGMGTVFYSVYNNLYYKDFWLNDINTNKFLRALTLVKVSDLPDKVSKSEFENLKQEPLTVVARVLEPLITWGGKGYPSGYDGSGRYTKAHYGHVIEAAKEILLLANPVITGVDYEEVLLACDENDFVYLDPPYLDNDISTYENIDHEKLVRCLDQASYTWILSGYENSLYNTWFGEPVARITKKADLARDGNERIECIWSNY